MKNILILSFVSVVLLSSVVFYLLFSGETPVDNMSVDTTSSTVETEQVVSGMKGTGSLETILTTGLSLECEISYESSAVTAPTEGTYFTAGGRLRGDFIVPEMASGSVSSLIVRDSTLYTWSVIDGETYGMKVGLDTLKEASRSDTAPEIREPVPLDAVIAYDCQPWKTVDNSIFETPSYVIFTDYADIINVGMEFSTIYEEVPIDDQCTLCQSLAGEAKAACRVQFKCK